MTKKELRIAVAKDVLKSLARMNVKTGKFVYSENVPAISENSKATATRLQATCEVCALGACLLSLVKLDNKFDFVYAGLVNDTGVRITDNAIFGRLAKVFSELQMKLIENAFEMGEGWYANVQGFEHTSSAGFGVKYEDDSTRLKAIMQNIVKNDGTFKP